MPLQFEWDLNKARTNVAKHGVSFQEAMTVFADPLARIFTDEAHSADERREINRSLNQISVALGLFCRDRRAGALVECP